jgi:transposase
LIPGGLLSVESIVEGLICKFHYWILESMRAHWGGLTLFVEHPQIAMGNNGAERAARPAAIGRNNFYGSG